MNAKAKQAIREHRATGYNGDVRLVITSSKVYKALIMKGINPFFTCENNYGIWEKNEEVESVYLEEGKEEREEELANIKRAEEKRLLVRSNELTIFFNYLMNTINYPMPEKYKSIQDAYAEGYMSMISIRTTYIGYPEPTMYFYFKDELFAMKPADSFLIGQLRYGATIITKYGLTRSLLNKYFRPFEKVRNPNYKSGPLASLYREKEVEEIIRTNEELKGKLDVLQKRRERRAETVTA
jgi:hypothetical protein